jgi:hypothetical protein
MTTMVCIECESEKCRCYTPDSISWGELATLTHETQVQRFGFCSCEDNEGQENPYSDCPKEGDNE